MASIGGLAGFAGLGGAIGKAIVVLELSTAKYQSELAAAKASTEGTSRAIGNVAGTASKVIGVGLGVAGAAAVKFAYDYDQSFRRIDAISNASAASIQQWKGEVLGLAGETAQAPKELADALFFLASAGLDAGEVMPALEASARASAVGLGETADVASIVASALNAYAKSGLTATQATDVLVAAVREGRAEPEEFAGALGRILPIASTIGITFDQVAASLASLSNIGLDVNEGVTAMRGVFQAIAAPGKQAGEAIESIGLSSQQLLDVVAEEGIVGALRLLHTTVKQNTKGTAEYNNVMRQIVPNVRSLTGVFGLTVQEASKVDAIFEAVKNSSGALGDAFRDTAESASFQMEKALNDIRVELTALGSKALPTLASVLQAVAPLFSTLARNIDVLIAAMIALKVASATAGTSFATFGKSLGGVVLLIGGAITAGRELNEAFYGTDATFEELASTLNDQLTPAFEAGLITYDQWQAAQAAIASGSFGNVEALLEVSKALEEEAQRLENEAAFKKSAANASDVYVESLNRMRPPLRTFNHDLEESVNGFQRFAGLGKRAFKDFAEAVGETLQVAIGDFKNFEDAFSTTPAELQRQARVAVRVAETMRSDLKTIFRSPDLSEAQKEALASLPADQRRAWVEAGDAAKDQIAKDAVKVANANRTAVRLAARLAQGAAESGGKSIGSDIMSGVATGIRDGAAAAATAGVVAVNEVIARMNRAARTASPSRLTWILGKNLMEGLANGISDAEQKAIDAVVTAVENSIDRMEDDLKKAEGALDRLRSKASGFRDAIAGAFDTGFGGFGQGGLEGMGVEQFIEYQVLQAQHLADIFEALRRQGASSGLLAEVASVGPEFGQALLQAGPEAIASANAALRELEKIAGETAKGLTEDFFGRKIDRLTEEVKELRQDLKKWQHGHDIIVDGDRLARLVAAAGSQRGSRNGGNTGF